MSIVAQVDHHLLSFNHPPQHRATAQNHRIMGGSVSWTSHIHNISTIYLRSDLVLDGCGRRLERITALLLGSVLPLVCKAFNPIYGNCGEVKCTTFIKVYVAFGPSPQEILFSIQLLDINSSIKQPIKSTHHRCRSGHQLFRNRLLFGTDIPNQDFGRSARVIALPCAQKYSSRYSTQLPLSEKSCAFSTNS